MFKSFQYILLAFIISFNSFSQQKEIIPTEILFKKNTFYNYTLSPNGKYFAAIMNTNNQYEILVIDIDEYTLYKRILIGNKFLYNLTWLTSNRLMYGAQGLVYAIDIDGTNSSTIVDNNTSNVKSLRSLYKQFRVSRVLNTLPDKKDEVLVETYNYQGYASVKRANIFTGETYTIASGIQQKMNGWLLDKNGNIKLGLRVDSKQNVIYFKENQKTNKWEEFEIYLNGEKYSLNLTAPSFFDKQVTFEGFGYKPNIAYLTTNIDSDKRKLIEYNIKENSVESILVEDKICDVSDPPHEEIRLIFDDSKKELIAVKYNGIIPQYKWISTQYGLIYDKINEKYPSYVHELYDIDEKGTKLLIKQWNDHRAEKLVVYNIESNSLNIILDINEELNNYKLSKTKNIIINTRDNYKIPGYLNLPINNKIDSVAPLVVIPHGGPWARDYYELNQFSQYFATRGYVTLRLNYRGSTGFGKKHLMAGVSSIDSIMINDIADGVKQVSENYNIDKNKIFIFGHSYGGYAAYMSLVKYPELYNRAVALSAPTNIKLWMKEQKKEKNDFAFEFWETALGTKDKKYFAKISPINYVKDITKPLLIFHGKYDQIVPLEQAKSFELALRKLNKDVTLRVLQNEGHSIHDGNNIGYILNNSNEFFKKD